MERKAKRGTAFKKSYVAAAPKLIEAGVTAREHVVYNSLTRMCNEQLGYTCTRLREEVAKETGLKLENVKGITRRLAARTFTWHGKDVPVIEVLEPGHKGHATVYRDNLTAYCLHQDEDPANVLRMEGEDRP